MAKNSFMWTDDEVELLLSVTLQYKCEKTEEGTDWETALKIPRHIAGISGEISRRRGGREDGERIPTP